MTPALTFNTPLADLNNGQGIDFSSGLQVTVGGNTQTISLTGDVTVQDLLNSINNSGAGPGRHDRRRRPEY